MLDIPEGAYGRTRAGEKVGPLRRVLSGYIKPGFYYTCDQMRSGYYAEGCSQRDGKERPTDLVAIWQDGPVVTETVTKTRIVPGVYDGVRVKINPTPGKVFVYIHETLLDADQLDAAAAVLSALAKGLRDA